jgi:hypothetical protein
MKKLAYFLFLLFTFLLVSCKKEIVPAHKSDLFVIGESESGDITLHTFSPQMTISTWQNGGEKSDSIDLNMDGVYDLKIFVYGKNWANRRISMIESLHSNLEFLCQNVQDTLWLTPQNTNASVNADSVLYNSYSGFGAGQTNAMINSIMTDYYPKKLNAGTTNIIGNANNVWSRTGVFSRNESGYDYNSANVYHHVLQGFWSGAGFNYLCFKLEINGQTKYGWLKMSIENDLTANVLEFAIEN